MKPWIVAGNKFIDAAEKAKKEASEAANAGKALFEQTYKAPKRGKGIAKAAWKGVETYGNQVQSVPAALFTQGQVQDGQYTTRRNLVGNPIANVQSHVRAQRGAGIAPTGNPIAAGFKSANLAGKAYSEDPDIRPGLKAATGIVLDPTSFVPGGVLAKGARLAGKSGKVPKIARGALSTVEGFDNLKSVGLFAGGAALGTEAATKYDVPGVAEPVEQIVGSMGGGMGALFPTSRRIGAAAMAGASGMPPTAAATTDIIDPTMRIWHGGPYTIKKGEMLNSQKGDLGNVPGMHWTRSTEIVNDYTTGDSLNVSQHPAAIKQREKVAKEGGQQVIGARAKRDLKLLVSQDGMTSEEITAIQNALPYRITLRRTPNAKLVAYSHDDLLQEFNRRIGFKPNKSTHLINGYHVIAALNDIFGIEDTGWKPPSKKLTRTARTLEKAGWDGLSSGETSSHDQITLFRPNEVLEYDLTLPTSPKQEIREESWNPGQTVVGLAKQPLWKPLFNKPAVGQGSMGLVDSVIAKLNPSEEAENYVQLLEKNGHIKGLDGGPANLFSYTDSPELIKSWYKALDKASTSSYLDAAGNKQLDDAIKIMDELEPIKGADTSLTGEQYAEYSDMYYSLGDKINDYENVLDSMGTYTDKEAYDALKKFTSGWENTTLGKEGWTEPEKFAGWLTGKPLSSGEAIDKLEPYVNDIAEYLGEFTFPKSLQSALQAVVIKPTIFNVSKALDQVDAYWSHSSLYDALKDVDDILGKISTIISDDTFEKSIEPKVAQPATNPITPESIIGAPKPSVEDYIQANETGGSPINPNAPEIKVGDKVAKSPGVYYTPPNQEGAPIAGQNVGGIKLSGEQQAKVDEILAKNPDLDPDTVAKMVKFDSISGGAPPETLVKAQKVGVGLTKGEHVSNQLTKIKRFIIRHGVENEAVATPISKEYLRINNIVKEQSSRVGKLAQRAERLMRADDPSSPTITEANLAHIDTSRLSKENRDIVIELQRSMEAYQTTLDTFGAKAETLTDFANEIRAEAGKENLPFSDVLTLYGNNIANKVSDRWLKDELEDLASRVVVSKKTAKVPTKSPLAAKEVKLPPEVVDVVDAAFRKVHPSKPSDASSLYTAINNTLRGLWATADASMVGIQMLPTWADNPKLALEIVKAIYNTIKDPTAWAKYAELHDAKAYGTRPTSTEWVAHGLHIAKESGETDLGALPERIRSVPGIGKVMTKADRLFVESGNFNRMMLADYLYDNWKSDKSRFLNGLDAKKGATDAEVLEAIAKAANRATGWSDTPFGGNLGGALFFAPRFMQSQFETVVKSVTDGGIEGKVARRQMIKLVAMGTGLTVAANMARGEDTEFNPYNSNFMRIRNIKGVDVSVFGPWDTLVRGLIKSAPSISADGEVSLGDPKYFIRSKLSPILSSGSDILTGSNLVGEEVKPQMPTSVKGIKANVSVARDTLLPFSLRDIGREPVAKSVSGIFGVKGSPLTGKEKLENTLEKAGIKADSPDYLIDKREYLSTHPEAVPSSQSKDFKRAQEVQSDIKARRQINSDKTISGDQTLGRFRKNRTVLLQEQRDKLEILLGNETKQGDTKQEKWVNSYFKLFEKSQDDLKQIDQDKFDAEIAQWINSNGAEALDFVNRYMGAGLSEVERAYYNDLRTLDADGYFTMPRYTKMKSKLTDAEIDNYKQKVSAARAADPNNKEPFEATVRRLYAKELTSAELTDISNSTKEAFTNPDLIKYKNTHRKELLWFNSNADWNAYTTAVNKKPTSQFSLSAAASTGTRRKLNVLSGSTLKSALTR